MGLISSSIPNFVNGVSQQPFTLRLNSQGESQVNCLSTVSQGLKKRPPTKHLAKIASSPLAEVYTHTINRDATERYQVFILNGDLKVYDLAGNQKTVSFPHGKTYLNASSPKTSFQAVTVADYTFITNKTVNTAMSATNVAGRPYEALISVTAGNYGKTYSVIVGGSSVASFTTPLGATSSDVTQISTDYIASQLYSGLVGAGYNTAPWSVARYGSVIYLANSSSDFTIRVEDGFNNNAAQAIKRTVQKFASLPSNAGVNGFTVEVVGDQSSSFDNYWVKFDTSGSSVGVWRETAKPGRSVGVDPATMPHTLVRNADGTFTFDQATFNTRDVGDDTSTPNPSFIGRPINDVFFYKNRLCFLADENFIASESGNYFNFFRTTVTALLDSDPIDVASTSTKVSVLKQAVPFNKQLLLFSDQTQFVIDQNDLLTPKSVGIKEVTQFPCNTIAKPVGVGKNVYFSVDKDGWSTVREYFADLNNITNDSVDVTGHVPKYIPSGIVKIAAAPNEDILVFLTSNDPTSLYVYKYFWANSDKLQSSWSKWTFGNDTILSAEFLQSELYLVLNRSDGAYFEKINVALGDIETGEPYQVLLDRKVQLPAAALSYSGGYTTINLSYVGYTPLSGETYEAILKNSYGTHRPGERLAVLWDGTTAKIKGDYTGCQLSFGRQYIADYELSPITYKQQSQTGGQKSDTEGRLQIRKLAINYADAGYFKVTVTPLNRDTYTYIYSGKTLGTTAVIGQTSLNEGRFVVPVVARNTEVSIHFINDSPLPASFLSADWEGFYVKRSQTV